MKKTIFILLIVLFSCKEIKENPLDKTNEVLIKENINEDSFFEFVKVKELRKNFTENKKKYTIEYEVDNINIKISDSLNTNDNFNLKQVFINNELVFSTKSETWIFIPYYCRSNHNKLLFFEEGDEGGTWGYNVVLLKDNINKLIGFLNFSSLNFSQLDEFISLHQENNFIYFNFLEPEVYLESEETNIKSSEINIKINLNTSTIFINEKETKNINELSLEKEKDIEAIGENNSEINLFRNAK